MKITLLAILTFIFLLSSTVFAQQKQLVNTNRIPTPEELRIKEELQKFYLELKDNITDDPNLKLIPKNLNIVDPKESDFLSTWKEISINKNYAIQSYNAPTINSGNSTLLKGGDGGNHIYVTGPEQNCGGALEVCSQTYTQAIRRYQQALV